MTDLTSLPYLSATEALISFRAGTLSPTELLEAVIRRIEEVNPVVNAFTELYLDSARQQAAASDERYRKNQARRLEGIVLAVKDSTPLAGTVNTMGSMLLRDSVATTTHPGLQRMIDEGVVIVGRTTMPEFGEAGNCYTPLWGVTRNPWNPDFGPGGSSSGAAAALAAGMTTIADGSDIGGSSRIPAACCGVYGFKPPYGRNPNTYEGSFDPYLHYGPLTRTVEDMALVQNVVSGFSLEDIGTLRDSLELPTTGRPIAGTRIAHSVDLGYFQVDAEVRAAFEHTLKRLEALGCELVPVSLDWTEDVYDAWATMNSLKGTAARRVVGHEDKFDQLADYTTDMLGRSSDLSSDAVTSAIDLHVKLYRDLGPVLEESLVFLCPTNAVPSIPAEQSPLDQSWSVDGTPVSATMAEAWFMTYPFNMLSQLPALSVPIGQASTGVPIGMQIVGKSFDETGVFDVAYALQEPTVDWPMTAANGTR